MALGLIGRKCGMTRVFCEDGTAVPVTILQIDRNTITQIKSNEKDGYRSIQVSVGDKKSSRVNKAMSGHYASANVTAGIGLWEFRINDENIGLTIGSTLPLNSFSNGQFVDIKGKSIGKGFAGGIKRHNFSMQDATHGNSRSHRVLGSIGMNQTPGRVLKGKKMEGHLGDVNVTIQNLTIHTVDLEKELIFIKGAVPGSNGGYVVITPAIKKHKKG